MGTKLLALLEVTRPHSALAAALATWVGARQAGAAPSATWFLAIAVTWLLAAAGNSYNDSRDAMIDAVNRPGRPVPSGRLSSAAAARLAHACAGIALALAVPLGTLSIVGTAAGILLLYGYSSGLRNIPLVGNAVVGGLSAMAVVYGGVVGGNVWAVWPMAALACLLVVIREVLKTIPDETGDRLANLRTVATFWGTERAITAVMWGGLFLAVVPAARWALGPPLTARNIILAAVYYLGLAYGVLCLWHKPTTQTAKHLVAASKAWLFALLAVMFLT